MYLVRKKLEASIGVDTFVEIGPGKSLQGFVKRIDRKISCYNVSDLESLKQTIEALKA